MFKQALNNIIILDKEDKIMEFFDIVCYADFVFQKTNKKGIIKVLKDRTGKFEA